MRLMRDLTMSNNPRDYLEKHKTFNPPLLQWRDLQPDLLSNDGSIPTDPLESQDPITTVDSPTPTVLPLMAPRRISSSKSDSPAHEDVSSPFFLNAGDHPSLVLVSSVLTGSNYQSWKRATTMALTAKNKTGFIDGSLARPTAGYPLLNSWTRCNNMVMSWLLHSVSPEISQTIMFVDFASDMWKYLSERFNQGNGPRIFQLQTQLTHLQQGHLVEKCYFIHGFPPGYGDQTKPDKGKFVVNLATSHEQLTDSNEASPSNTDLVSQCQ
uniref:Retrotransposon Copia-like N-terminal domain-containing protein n=1 Tax=Cannabis sativa TaxID=3483 RepID=A0A803Q048_CANSA